jgi:fatty acid desaturase
MHLGFQLHCNKSETNVSKESKSMLWTIFVILLVLWLLGLVTSYTFGGFVHILLVLAVIVLVFQLISGRRAI